MVKKRILFLFGLFIIILILLISGCDKEDIRCDFEKYKKSIGMDEADLWTCKMVVTGVIYDKETGKCVEKMNNACKNPYPFTTIEECEKICIENLQN